MTDKCILEAYKNMAIRSVILAVEDFLKGEMDVGEFRHYCLNSSIIDLLGLNGEWVFEIAMKKKREEFEKYNG